MKKFALLFLLVAMSVSYAQVTTLWEKSAGASTLPSWFSTGNNERAFALNKVTNQLVIVSRNGGIKLVVINAANGDSVKTLDPRNISGGVFNVSDAGFSTDGVLYVCNMNNSAAGPINIYRFATVNDTAKTSFSGIITANAKRIGDMMTVVGSTADNSLLITLADATANKVFVMKTADNGNTLFVADSITLPAATFGGAPVAYPSVTAGNITKLITKSTGKMIQVWNVVGNVATLAGSSSSGEVASGSTGLAPFTINGSNFIATQRYAIPSMTTIYDMQGDTAAYYKPYITTPTLGSNANGNGSGDVEVVVNNDGTVTLYNMSANNGFGAYKISFPLIVNGRFHEAYDLLATKLNSNAGFGNAIDVKQIGYKYYNDTLYIALTGRLNKSSGDGIMLLINTTGVTGAAAGTALGNVTGGGHVFGNNGVNSDWKAGFEVDYGFAFNPGSTDTTVYVDAVKYVGTPAGQYVGASGTLGSAVSGPSADGVFKANSIVFAYDKAVGTGRGIEIRIPFSEIGATPTSKINVFAAVVSSTAYFSDVTVPGNVGGGNLANNPNFNTVAGGPYYSADANLPVELTSFVASVTGTNVTLDWNTATELNNKGFAVERSINGAGFERIAFVQGKGTSSSTNKYQFTDKVSKSGNYSYRLRQEDFDGTFSYSSIVEADVNANPNVYALEQNYPNPFNPSTKINFSLAEVSNVKLTVYNVLGQVVRTLVNSQMSAGSHTVSFDASGLGSGLYIYKLEAGNFTATRKMQLLK